MDFTNFFSQVLSDPNSPESIRILIILIGGFLVGLTSGMLIGRSLSKKWRKSAREDKESLNALQAKFAALQEEFDLQLADLQKSENELNETRARVTALTAENGRLSEELSAANNKIEHLEARVQADSALMEDLRHQILGQKARLKELSDESNEGAGAPISDTATLHERLSEVEKKLPEIEARLRDLPSLGKKDDSK